MDLRQKVDLIKENVTMLDVLNMCGIQTRGKQEDRIPCPIHVGRNKNFSYMERGFHCFKCDAKGDVIKFIELYKNVDFKTAIDLINNEFGLWDNSRFKHSNRPIQARKRERQLSDYKELFKALGERHTAELNKLLEKKCAERGEGK